MTGPPGWPVTLADGPVGLRPLRRRDAGAWTEVRLANRDWLAPWEPDGGVNFLAHNDVSAYGRMLRALRRQGRTGIAMPLAVTFDGRLVGQLTVGNIVRGSLNGAYLGYWLDRRYAGRGIMPTAVALVADHAFGPGRLHRLEANIRPENLASRRVAEKLGFVEEGLRRRYLFIDGAYRDHVCYVLLREDVAGGVLRRWHERRPVPPAG